MGKAQTRIAVYVRSLKRDKAETRKQIYKIMQKYDTDNNLLLDLFVDNGYSGNTEYRPQYKKLLKGIAEKKFDLVVACSIDRFARTHYILKKFIRHCLVNDCEIETLDMERAKNICDFIVLPHKVLGRNLRNDD